MKSTYLHPHIRFLEVIADEIICTSPGIDPGGIGHDFDWGNDIGINPGGNGYDFNWGN